MRANASASLPFVLLFLYGTSVLNAQARPCAHIDIDATHVVGPVNGLIFGHNIEAADGRGIFTAKFDPASLGNAEGMWDPVKRAPIPAVLAKAKEIHMQMLRYPGGCLVHGFDWKKAVGPIEQRGDWKFGIDEYIELCRELGAEPLMQVSDYTGTPRDQADLVEYLNSSATPEHPWAMKRKQWGHPEPFAVKYFELGNESDHGNHNLKPHKKWTAEQYAQYAIDTAEAMRKVDPKILIGIMTIPGDGTTAEAPYNQVVMHLAGPIADFVTIHVYAPITTTLTAGLQEPPSVVIPAMMGIADQHEHQFAEYRGMIKRECGRDLPLAMTEYNAGVGVEKPIAYRLSFAAGLMCADMMRIALKPENHILMANYWQFINGYWGMMTTWSGIKYRPAYPLYRLWGEHFGDTLVDVHVDTPRAEVPRSRGFAVAKGDRYQPSQIIREISAEPSTSAIDGTGLETELRDGVFRIRLNSVTKSSFHQLLSFGARPASSPDGYSYHLSFEGRFVPGAGSGSATLGLGLADTRGWETTHCAVAITDVESASDWQPFEGTLQALPDTPAISVPLRIENVIGPFSGTLEFRNIRSQVMTPTIFPAYEEITSSASISADQRTLYLIVFNKSVSDDIETTFRVNGFNARSARLWQVTGPDLSASTSVEETTNGKALDLAEGALEFTLPAHSMSAIEYKSAQ